MAERKRKRKTVYQRAKTFAEAHGPRNPNGLTPKNVRLYMRVAYYNAWTAAKAHSRKESKR